MAPCAIITFASSNAKFDKSETKKRSDSADFRLRPRQAQAHPKAVLNRKGQQWYFGMKLHIGVDSQSGLTHSAVVTAANVHDKHPLPDLLHGQERRVYGDSAYASQEADRRQGA